MNANQVPGAKPNNELPLPLLLHFISKHKECRIDLKEKEKQKEKWKSKKGADDSVFLVSGSGGNLVHLMSE